MNCLLTKTIGKPVAYREKLKGAQEIGGSGPWGFEVKVALPTFEITSPNQK